MREYVNGVITVNEARSFCRTVGYLDFSDIRLAGILGYIQGFAGVSLSVPSYVRVEDRRQGHPWHTDRGNKGHMGWCDYSGTILLTDPKTFDGGGLYFSGDEEPSFHYRDLVFYDSDVSNRHFVASNSGGRKALIMFFASK